MKPQLPGAVSAIDLSINWATDARLVLDSLTFEVPMGQRVLLVGPSGAGKSTLLLALAGVLAPLELAQIRGSLTVFGSGLLLQNPFEAAVGSSVLREVAFGAESMGLPSGTLPNLVDLALAQVGLSHLDLQQNPRQLSGGELQRLCLAGLITLAPKLLLLDEPTAMLDSQSAAEVRAAVAAYLAKSGATVVIAEHRYEDWLPLVDRVLVLNAQGQITDDLPPGEVTPPGYVLGDFAPAPEAGGKITALVGPSGSGKSTRLTSMLEQAFSSGQSVGWLPQNAGFTIAGATVLDSCAATLQHQTSWKQARQQAAQILESLDLASQLDHSPHELSGGQLRRLALASALVHDPGHLFLDEPTLGQDPDHWQQIVRQILLAKEAGTQVVLATHDEQLLAFCDEVIVVEPQVARPLGDQSPATPVSRTTHASVASHRFSPLAIMATSIELLAASWLLQSLTSLLLGFSLEVIWLALAVFSGFPVKKLKLLIPATLGVLSIGFSNWLLSANHAVEPAAMAALRVAFFALPGVLLASCIRTDALADQLGQTLGLPGRPVLAATAAMARVWDFGGEWNRLRQVRRIRKVSKRNPVLEAGHLTLLLLVSATRGATQTAIAMESRGFSFVNEAGKYAKRSWVVPARWGSLDGLLILAPAAILAGVFVLAGWR